MQYRYKTFERGGGWAQSNQKTIKVTSKNLKNMYFLNHEKLQTTLILGHFDGDWPRGGAFFDVTIQGKRHKNKEFQQHKEISKFVTASVRLVLLKVRVERFTGILQESDVRYENNL